MGGGHPPKFLCPPQKFFENLVPPQIPPLSVEKIWGGIPPQIFPPTGGGFGGGQGFLHAKLRPRRNFGDFERENAEIFAGGTLFFPLVT